MHPGHERRRRFETLVAEIYEPLQRFLRRRARPDDADELLNDVLTVIWRRLDDVPEGTALPWSYGVARRCLANRQRSNRRHLRLLDRVRAATSNDRGRFDPGEEAGLDADPALHEALARLGEHDREIVRLWAWEQLEPREIATVVDSTPNAVSIRLHRAKRRLEADLGRKNGRVGGHIRGEHQTEHDR